MTPSIPVSPRTTIRRLLQLCLLLCLLSQSMASAVCPSLCECKWMNGKESVRCHNANLTEIPPRLDAGTQVLDLQHNAISHLDGDKFSAVGLLNLQKIFLVDCQVRQLHRYAFRNLINLVELDLSGNLLASIPSHVFDSMAELRELRLSSNPVLRLEDGAFKGLLHLVRLELSDCRISHIEPQAFEGVHGSLEWLKVDGNALENVLPASFTLLHNLHGIELTRNPWNCTCSLHPLRLWLMQQNIPYEVSPVCAQPERLRGRLWSRLDVSEFACPPTLSVLHGGRATVKAIEGQNVTIGCAIGGGEPEPTVRWMFRGRVIVGDVSLRGSLAASSPASPAAVESGRGLSSVAAITTLDTRRKIYHHLGRTASNVTIAWVDSHDSGTYKCIAENAAGRSEATVSVLVYSRHYLIDSNNNAVEVSQALAHSHHRMLFLVSTVVAVLFVLLSLLLALCLYAVHRKKARSGGPVAHLAQTPRTGRKEGWRRSCLHFLWRQKRGNESYEKIEMLTRTVPVDVLSARRREETHCGLAEGEEEEVVVGRECQAVQSIEEKRRSMSLNLSDSPTTRKATKMSCRRRNGDFYSNVPTTADDEEPSGCGGVGLQKWKQQNSSVNGGSRNRFLKPQAGEREAGSQSAGGDASSNSNSNLSGNSRGNFPHPLADLCPTSTSTDPPVVSEIIRHHVMRKRLLTEAGEAESGVAIYTTTQLAAGEVQASQGEQKEGRLSPTLRSILRNDENFDLFDVKSTLDDFYVKQLKFDYEQQRLWTGGGEKRSNFCSLPRKRPPYDCHKNSMALSSARGEDLFDAPLEDSLFRSADAPLQPQRQQWSSQLDLVTHLEGSASGAAMADVGRAPMMPLGGNNRATPLLNIPTGATATNTVMGNGVGIGQDMATGIFPSNCGSPSMGVGGCPPTTSLLSPSSSSQSSAAVGSGGKDYDYHAAQLEMFLSEYKRLQQQLCKMKETCESITRTEELYGAAGVTRGHQQVTGKMLLPKTLPVGNKHKSFSGRTPEPPPYWLHRNELLKGMQQQLQQGKDAKADCRMADGTDKRFKSPERENGDGMSSG